MLIVYYTELFGHNLNFHSWEVAGQIWHKSIMNTIAQLTWYSQDILLNKDSCAIIYTVWTHSHLQKTILDYTSI